MLRKLSSQQSDPNQKKLKAGSQVSGGLGSHGGRLLRSPGPPPLPGRSEELGVVVPDSRGCSYLNHTIKRLDGEVRRKRKPSS